MTSGPGDVTLTVFGLTDVGMVRQNNEDAFIIADLTTGSEGHDRWVGEAPVGERGVLLAVSDGMGGADAGEVASAMTVESLRELLGTAGEEGGTQQLVQKAVEEANRNVWDASQEPGRQGMGATLTAVLIRGSNAHIAEVGDSRAYLIRGSRIRQVTRDQSYVEMLVQSGMITRAEAERSPYRNVILQAMGKKPQVVVAIGKLALRRADRLLLCSDGLSGKVTDDEMLATMASCASLEDACRRLVDLAKQRGGEDNITVILAELSGSGLPEVSDGEGVTRTLKTVKEFDLSRKAPRAPASPDDSVPTPIEGTPPVNAPAAPAVESRAAATVRELAPPPTSNDAQSGATRPLFSNAAPAVAVEPAPVAPAPEPAHRPSPGSFLVVGLGFSAVALLLLLSYGLMRLFGYEIDFDLIKDLFD